MPSRSPFLRLLIAVNRWLVRRISRDRVLAGPFRGMRYTTGSGGSAYAPKLLGTYELELAPWLSDLTRTPVGHVVDIGAAEGFYAVGCARLLGCPVTAFETEQESRRLLADMAARNGVADRVRIEGACDADALRSALESAGLGPVLVICDVEGYEGTLLDPEKVPGLRECRLVVEMHDCFRPGVSERVTGWFSGSHRITRIPARPRTDADLAAVLPEWRLVPAALRRRWMDERRPAGMSWLVMEPAGKGAEEAKGEGLKAKG